MPELRLTPEQRELLKHWSWGTIQLPEDRANLRTAGLAAIAEIDALRTYFCAEHLPTGPNEIREHVPCVQCLADWFEAKCEEAVGERNQLRAAYADLGLAAMRLHAEQGHYYDAGDLLAEADGGPKALTELERIAAMCDGRPMAFLEHLRARARELCPDYPFGPPRDDAFDWLWAIVSSLEGITLANDDCHKEISRLRALATRYSDELRCAELVHSYDLMEPLDGKKQRRQAEAAYAARLKEIAGE